MIPPIPFYFIRHGQTDWNREGRLMGQNDIPLNQHGIAQAQEAAAYLKANSVAINKIVASPLLRAKQTAEIISTAINVPVKFNADLKEGSFGIAEGKLKAYENLHESWISGVTPEGAESWVVFQKRVINAAAQSMDDNGNTLIVAHGGVYSAIMDFLGYKNQDADNCVLYFFNPPALAGNLWNICNINDQ